MGLLFRKIGLSDHNEQYNKTQQTGYEKLGWLFSDQPRIETDIKQSTNNRADYQASFTERQRFQSISFIFGGFWLLLVWVAVLLLDPPPSPKVAE